MLRFAPGIIGLALFAFNVWAIIDVFRTEKSAFRRLSKFPWILIVAFLPPLGAVLWVLFGRPANAGFAPGATLNRKSLFDSSSRPLGPEDSEAWAATTPPKPPSSSSTSTTRRLSPPPDDVDFTAWEEELSSQESDSDDESA